MTLAKGLSNLINNKLDSMEPNDIVFIISLIYRDILFYWNFKNVNSFFLQENFTNSKALRSDGAWNIVAY